MTADHDALALRLRQAYSGGPVPPLRDGLDPLDEDGAYAVQSINTRFWEAAGRRIAGAKIGLTAEAVQRQLGVDRPDYGVLFDDMRLPDGATLDPARLLQGKAEAEIALLMGEDLADPEAGPDAVRRAAAYALPAIEIVDSRIWGWQISFADTVADNASSAFFVLGAEPVGLDGLDLVGCAMRLEADGAIASTGTGAACLGDPLEAAAWLARTLARRGGGLRAGDIVLTGALGPMVTLAPGMRLRATIEGLGTVGFDVAGAAA